MVLYIVTQSMPNQQQHQKQQQQKYHHQRLDLFDSMILNPRRVLPPFFVLSFIAYLLLYRNIAYFWIHFMSVSVVTATQQQLQTSSTTSFIFAHPTSNF